MINPNFNPDLKRVDEPDPFYDRKKFYDSVTQDPFGGSLTQDQVDGMNYLLDMWEKHFAPYNPNDGTMWLAYCLATAFHETDRKMRPIPEYGEGAGHPYGEPCGPYDQVYHGRGHVQLTWEDNYLKGQDILATKYGVDCPIHQDADRALEDEASALLLFDGSVYGWFTGASLQQYFNKAKGIEDPYNARRVINGTDKADLIKGYYYSFKKALT
jgi:hypothetical protein